MSISITRGDSATFIVSMKKDGVVVPFEAGDKVYFTVKTSVNTAQKLIQKVITTFETDGSAIIYILPEDTKTLEFKSYVYDVQLTAADGSVTTFIKPSAFIVGSEVTYE